MFAHRTTPRLVSAAAAVLTAAALVLVPVPGAHADGAPRAIHSYLDYTKCLEVADWRTDDGAPVRIWTCHGGANQQWIRTDNEEFVNVNSGKCLDVPNYSTEPGTPIVQWTCNRGLNQAWQMMRYTWHTEWFGVNVNSRLNMDVFEANPADGTPVIQWPGYSGYNQRWS
ncbi:RICIN domain-containing protein [Kitasatospora sp. NPDC008115]|uniref:RICIN domain-containing protein n=1 Tax=Kitasatospora sp. NPDC008115 TaxID=3364022 RepID=UPI0036EE752C